MSTATKMSLSWFATCIPTVDLVADEQPPVLGMQPAEATVTRAPAFDWERINTLAPVPGQRPGTILVVDDEEPVRTLIAHALRAAGYEVTLASGGEEALAASL